MSAIPSTVGRYRIERLLGQGAMGCVYLGRDPQLDRAVAVKTIRNLDLDAERLQMFLDRFRNEARAAGRLSHPGIVAVYDVGEDSEVGPFLVFEYVPGASLKQILRSRGAMEPKAVVKLGRQLAAALDTAHAADVIHRDIKPDNILVSALGDAKLADFGVARLPDAALTKDGQFLGTPCYAAPETLENGTYSPRSDLFSFVAVLYECITAKRAFPGDDALSVAHRVVHEEPRPPGQAAPDVTVPRGVSQVLLKGLSKNSLTRYANADEVMNALSQAYVEAGILERDPTGTHPLPPRERSNLSAWALVLLGCLILGIGIVISFGDIDDPWTPPTMENADAEARETGLEMHIDATSDAAALSAIPLDSGIVPPPEIDAPLDAGESPVMVIEGLEEMSAFEREEAAKDAIDAATERLTAGDLEGAASLLQRARLFDPGNDDIPALEEQLSASDSTPTPPPPTQDTSAPLEPDSESESIVESPEESSNEATSEQESDAPVDSPEADLLNEAPTS